MARPPNLFHLKAQDKQVRIPTKPITHSNLMPITIDPRRSSDSISFSNPFLSSQAAIAYSGNGVRGRAATLSALAPPVL